MAPVVSGPAVPPELLDAGHPMWHDQKRYRAYMSGHGWTMPPSERMGLGHCPGQPPPGRSGSLGGRRGCLYDHLGWQSEPTRRFDRTAPRGTDRLIRSAAEAYKRAHGLKLVSWPPCSRVSNAWPLSSSTTARIPSCRTRSLPTGPTMESQRM